jgi:hypothetical protein
MHSLFLDLTYQSLMTCDTRRCGKVSCYTYVDKKTDAYQAVEAPFVSERLLDEELVFRRMCAVDTVITVQVVSKVILSRQKQGKSKAQLTKS